MQVEIAYLISIVSLAFSVFFGLKSSKHTDTKDIEERVKDNTRINMKLDAIAGTTQEIKSEISTSYSPREGANCIGKCEVYPALDLRLLQSP